MAKNISKILLLGLFSLLLACLPVTQAPTLQIGTSHQASPAHLPAAPRASSAPATGREPLASPKPSPENSSEPNPVASAAQPLSPPIAESPAASQPGSSGGGSSPVNSSNNAVPPAPTPTPVPALTLLHSSEQPGQGVIAQTPALDLERERLVLTLFPVFLQVLNFDHSPVWHTELTYPGTTSPLIDADGNIYVGQEFGGLQSFNSEGEENWAVELGEASLSGLALDSELGILLASSENGVLYALNSSSGELLWERGLSFRLEGAPVISPDHRVFIGGNQGTWYALKVSDGSLSWRQDAEDKVGKQSAALALATVLMGYAEGGLYAFDFSGWFKWRFDKVGLKGSPVIDPWGQIYFVGQDHRLYAFSINGQELWTRNLEPLGSGELILDAEGHVYALSWNTLQVFNSEGELVAQQPFEQTLGGPTLDPDGQLHVFTSLGVLKSFAALAPMAEWLWPKAHGHAANTGQQKEWN